MRNICSNYQGTLDHCSMSVLCCPGPGRDSVDAEKSNKDDQRYKQLPITQVRRLQPGKQKTKGIYDKAMKNGEWHGKCEWGSVVHCLSQL